MKKILIVSLIFILCLICLCSCDWLPCKHTEAVDAAVAPTCTEAGLTEGKHCSKCGEVLVAQQPVAPLGHTEVIEESKNPTCTEDGYTAKVHCTVCGVTIIEKQTIPAAHTFGEWETIIEADCFLPGERQRSCSACDYVEAEAIATLSHSFVQNSESGLFSCEKCEATIFAGHLYAVIDSEKNWFDAYKFCDSIGGHLVTITSEREQNFIYGMMMNSERHMYWMGLVRNTDGWHWVTGEEFGYTSWQFDEPDNYTRDQWFAQIFGAKAADHNVPGKWNDINSVASNPFRYTLGLICEWELDIEESEHYFTEWETVTEVSCFGDGEDYRLCTHCGLEETRTTKQLEHSFSFNEATGVTSCAHCGAVKYEGRIYRVFGGNGYISWFDAKAACDKMGGHLVTITSEAEETFVEMYMRNVSFSSYAWLGGYNDGVKWNWVTGEEFGYSHWESGQPDCSGTQEFYLHINHLYFGGWNDAYPFTNVSYFICEWEAE